ncbi:hypothetical protein SLS55_001289 [Diplodia seriata]|uniref:Uncharacterized protein n=1 Tax=Diplodia seriata TaxID=420778 RepID=A0ABR3CXS2_9PEZI
MPMERSQAQEVGDPPPQSASPSSLDQKSGLTTASTTISAGDMEAPSSPGEAVTTISDADNPPSSPDEAVTKVSGPDSPPSSPDETVTMTSDADSPPSSPDEAVTTISGADNPPSSTGDLKGVPSRRSGRDVFNFMALSGELRNMIYEAVIDTMATTPDTPIALTPESDCNRKYTCWFGDSRDSYRKIHGLAEDESSDDENEDQVVLQAKHKADQAEADHITKLRKNFATCRLGEVSRQVRSEFQSLLFDRLHFRVCNCYDLSNIDDGSVPIRQLIGKIRHLDYFTHQYSTYVYEDKSQKLSDLVDLLLQLRFSGELKIVGWHDYVDLIRDCLSAFCASVYAGESNSKSREKAREVTDAYKYVVLARDRVELPFYFNHNDLRNRARSA